LHLMTNTPYPQDVAASYQIDSAASRFTVQAFAGGLFSSFGHNPVINIPDLAGEILLPENIEAASLTLTVQAASLRASTDITEKDRREIERVMHEQVFNSQSYPEIVYECSRVSASKTGEGQYWTSLDGDLTLHGVTRRLTIPTRISVNGDKLKASGNFSLLQSNYEIERISFAGGTLKVKDEVKFAFDIVARKQG
jgi:polyisoprenoid-binding protein YceI